MFLSIKGVITPPIVSIPSVKGVTSKSNTSVTSPASTAPWIAAPTETASSGFTSFLASLPKKDFTFSCTRGILVCPPTKITSSTSEAFNPASLRAISVGFMVRSTKFSTRDSNLALVSL